MARCWWGSLVGQQCSSEWGTEWGSIFSTLHSPQKRKWKNSRKIAVFCSVVCSEISKPYLALPHHYLEPACFFQINPQVEVKLQSFLFFFWTSSKLNFPYPYPYSAAPYRPLDNSFCTLSALHGLHPKKESQKPQHMLQKKNLCSSWIIQDTIKMRLTTHRAN